MKAFSGQALPEDIELLGQLTTDWDSEIRATALSALSERFPQAVVRYAPYRSTATISELIETLRNPPPKDKLTDAQLLAGGLIALYTRSDFHFSTPAVCISHLLGARDMIGKGRRLGGEKGDAMVAAGKRVEENSNRELRGYHSKYDAAFLVERVKLLKWWDTEGHKRFY